MSTESTAKPWEVGQGKLLRKFTVEVYENGMHLDTHDTCDYIETIPDMLTLLSQWNNPNAKAYDAEGNEQPVTQMLQPLVVEVKPNE